MAKGPYGKGNITDARHFLASLPEFTEHSQKGAYGIGEGQAQRLANAFAKQIGSGVTPNYEAARGHVFTPEHPGRRRPNLPEPARNYTRAPEKSKYAPTTREPGGGRTATPAPSQRVTGPLPEAPRPRRHVRQRFEGHIPFSDTGEIYTRNTARAAESVLHYASGLEPVGRNRITMQVYDCTRAQWFPVLSHTWKSGGIAIDDFYTLWRDHSGSLEDYLIDQINGNSGLGDSDPSRHGRISHICQYEITILPRATVLRTG